MDTVLSDREAQELTTTMKLMERPPYAVRRDDGKFDDRLTRAYTLVADGRVTLRLDGTYTIQGSTKRYAATLLGGCSCPQGSKSKTKWCYHLVACELHKQWQLRLGPEPQGITFQVPAVPPVPVSPPPHRHQCTDCGTDLVCPGDEATCPITLLLVGDTHGDASWCPVCADPGTPPPEDPVPDVDDDTVIHYHACQVCHAEVICGGAEAVCDLTELLLQHPLADFGCPVCSEVGTPSDNPLPQTEDTAMPDPARVPSVDDPTEASPVDDIPEPPVPASVLSAAPLAGSPYVAPPSTPTPMSTPLPSVFPKSVQDDAVLFAFCSRLQTWMLDYHKTMMKTLDDTLMAIKKWVETTTTVQDHQRSQLHAALLGMQKHGLTITGSPYVATVQALTPSGYLVSFRLEKPDAASLVEEITRMTAWLEGHAYTAPPAAVAF